MTIQRLCQRTRSQSLPVQFGGVLAVVAVAAVAQLTVPGVATGYPLLFFFASNGVNGLLWKRPIALVGVALGTAVAVFIVIEPRGSFLIKDATDAIAIALFLAIGAFEVLVVSALVNLSESLETALERARKAEAAQAMLFAEGNHRIKNNLQLIAAFLNIEAREAASEEISATLRAAATRLHAVGQIHDRLTHADGADIDLDELLGSVCTHLAESVADGRRIRLSWASESRARLPAGPATAICLLANELVTNAFKHAFPDGASGSIAVTLRRDGGQLLLTVRDDGRGLADHAPGSGWRFVDTIAQDMQGEFTATSDGGTRADIRMPVPGGGDGLPH
jgi:two-component sensor histidine kinase